MFFGEVPIDEASGTLLAHSHRSERGRIRKGQVLNEQHIAQLHQDGITHVTVARLESDDVHEDAAAEAIARQLLSDHLHPGKGSTGRVNLHATTDGLLTFAAAEIHALNRIDESITVATLEPETRVTSGQIERL